MKNTLVLFALLCFMSFGINAQETVEAKKQDNAAEQTADEPQPIMVFESTTVDYGEIQQGSDPIRVVEFKNEGEAPLIIKHAKGSCGCTVPTVPKEPIMPGETNQIQIRYDTKRTGPINKTVKITTNEVGRSHTLFVKGLIHKKSASETQSVPPSEKSILSPQK